MYAFTGCTSLTIVYFWGNPPTLELPRIFNGSTPTVYYVAGSIGWGPLFDGNPTVQLGAIILTQPANVTARQWTRAIFSVTAVGASSYQWQKNGVNISLATTATLTLNNVQATDVASYTVVIFNIAGNLTSDAATLTVVPDTDADGLTNAEETTYSTDPNKADTDDDGIDDKTELQVYLSNPLVKDSDGDGFDDLFEVNTGFNPALAGSSPDSASSIGNAVGFQFNAGLGLSYRIEDSTDLQNWSTLETPVIGQGGVVTRFYFTEGHAKRYFRVRRN